MVLVAGMTSWSPPSLETAINEIIWSHGTEIKVVSMPESQVYSYLGKDSGSLKIDKLDNHHLAQTRTEKPGLTGPY